MSRNPNRPGAQRKFPIPIWLLIAAIIVLAIAAWGAYAMRGGGRPSAGPPQTSAVTTSDQPTGVRTIHASEIANLTGFVSGG